MPHMASAPTPTGPCPHCRSGAVQKHGSFPVKAGFRQQRFLCRACGRTHNPNTGTPLSYLKKRDRWKPFVRGMVRALSLRQTAAALHIHVSTAFRWRHRLISALADRQPPVLTGSVAVCEVYVPYSEKGSRKTDGTGAHGIRSSRDLRHRWSDRGVTGRFRKSGQQPFRRFIHGKPSCVLVACSGEQHAVVEIGRGRPTPEQLHSSMAPMLGSGVQVWGEGMAPYAEACRRLGVSHQQTWRRGVPWHPCLEADSLRRQLYGWFRPFCRVATRYLPRYLAWFRCAGWISEVRPTAALGVLLSASVARRRPSGLPA